MSFDLAAFLVLGVLVTGLVWLLDRIWLAPRRRARAPGVDAAEEVREPWPVEYARSFFPVFLIVLLLRSFVAEPFHIPTGSMIPTILIGDFVLVNKFSYGLRLPITDTKVVPVGEPRRGDVVVFRYPVNPRVDFVKRIIGVPGDHIVYRNKTLYINGHEEAQRILGPYYGPEVQGVTLRMEDLDGREHEILTMPGRAGAEGEYDVPPHSYFVMGDNRDNSNDSRYWGFVPEKNLVGKAFVVWLNLDGFPHRMPNWSRIGRSLQ